MARNKKVAEELAELKAEREALRAFGFTDIQRLAPRMEVERTEPPNAIRKIRKPSLATIAARPKKRRKKPIRITDLPLEQRTLRGISSLRGLSRARRKRAIKGSPFLRQKIDEMIEKAMRATGHEYIRKPEPSKLPKDPNVWRETGARVSPWIASIRLDYELKGLLTWNNDRMQRVAQLFHCTVEDLCAVAGLFDSRSITEFRKNDRWPAYIAVQLDNLVRARAGLRGPTHQHLFQSKILAWQDSPQGIENPANASTPENHPRNDGNSNG